MEGSKGEAVYDSMNLNPHLFINAALNIVQDVVDEAFHFYTLEASNLLKIDGPDDNNRSRELSKGIDRVRDMIQSVLDNRLEMWEHYCLRYTFAVPEDFVLLPTQSDDDRNIQPLTNDQELDAELDSLRRKLHLVGNRSVELNSELHALERKSASNARLVDEASKLYDQSSVDHMFKEMTEVALELRTGIINRLKARKMNAAAAESAKMNDFSATPPDGKIEDLDKFLAELRKM